MAKIFSDQGRAVERREICSLIYRIDLFGTRFSVDSEVNNGEAC